MADAQIEVIVRRALEEDMGDGDVTTDCTLSPTAIFKGQFIAKEAGIVAGLEVAKLTFALLDERVEFTPSVTDGDPVEIGQVIATLSGPGRAVLSGEPFM
jgi:nicotinate-nucleotide pyrophosphorylase (carboxylating)